MPRTVVEPEALGAVGPPASRPTSLRPPAADPGGDDTTPDAARLAELAVRQRNRDHEALLEAASLAGEDQR